MIVDWEFAAETFFDQLSSPEKQEISRSLEHAATECSNPAGLDLKRIDGLPGTDGKPIYVLRYDNDMQLLLAQRGNKIAVVDILRQRQINRLNALLH